MSEEFLLRDLQHLALRNLGVTQDSITSTSTGAPLLDVFYSLYGPDDVLLYVSEVAYGVCSPQFGVMQLPDLGKRCCEAKLRVWATETQVELKWTLYMEVHTDLRHLKPLGKAAHADDDVFASNAVVWCFNGEHYCLESDIKLPVLKSRTQSWNNSRKKPSYSVDDIRHISSLANGIRELESSKAKLAKQIDVLCERLTEQDHQSLDHLRMVKFDLHALHKYSAKQNAANDTVLSSVYTKKLHIRKIRQIIDEDFPAFREICSDRCEMAELQIAPIHELLHLSVYPELINILHNIGLVLQDAYPIDTSPEGRFTICGTEFPSSVKELLDMCYDGSGNLEVTDRSVDIDVLTIDKINAGLSHIVLLVQILAEVMEVPLKFQMTFSGSQCYLVDNLVPQQLEPTQRGQYPLNKPLKVIYPLYFDLDHTEKVAYDGRKAVLKNPRFEQGLNLLNKNLVMLINGITDSYSQYHHDNVAHHLISNNIPVDCLDNFLWNLQYLLLFVTAEPN